MKPDRTRRYLRFLGARPEADVEDEIAFHLEMRERELVERGMDPAQAREEAKRRFGDRARVEAQMRQMERQRARSDARRAGWQTLGGDVAFVVRTLVRQPVFALSVILTIDRTLNGIWRVRRARPLAQRVLMYWAVLSLGPLALAALLATGSYAASASRGLVSALPTVLEFALDVMQFALVAAGTAALFRYVPNTWVHWGHAAVGGVFVAMGLELAKKGLALYLSLLPGMSAIYGAFAAVPILLLWVYIVWLVVLLGAVIAAYLPALLAGVARRGGTPGWRFQLAVEAVQALDDARGTPAKGLNVADLAQRLKVDSLQLEPVIDTLLALDWVGQLEDGRDVLLVDLDKTSATPLIDALLLEPAASVENFRKNSQIPALNGRSLLQKQ